MTIFISIVVFMMSILLGIFVPYWTWKILSGIFNIDLFIETDDKITMWGLGFLVLMGIIILCFITLHIILPLIIPVITNIIK